MKVLRWHFFFSAGIGDQPTLCSAEFHLEVCVSCKSATEGRDCAWWQKQLHLAGGQGSLAIQLCAGDAETADIAVAAVWGLVKVGAALDVLMFQHRSHPAAFQCFCCAKSTALRLSPSWLLRVCW